MRVEVTGLQDTLKFQFELDKEDGHYTDKITMVGSDFSIKMPGKISINDVHPDHLALIALLVAHPFISDSITIPWAVSRRFAASCQKISRYNVDFDEGECSEYTPSHGARPALAFSGGADSTASLLVMPSNTLSVFMDRPIRKKTSIYNKSAALATVKFAKKSGFDVLSVECDVEYIRQPLGFATDLVPSIPILALAACFDIDAVAFGTVMESAYRIGHENARDYANSSHYRFWGRMFKAAGLPLYLPVSGVSEVGTSKIVLNSPFHPYTRSCIRGEWPQSCENCWKCFRKNMLEGKLTNGLVQESVLEKGLRIPEVKMKMSAFPVSHENVLAWTLDGCKGPVAELVLRRLEGAERDLSYLETYYPAAIDLMPKKYRDETKLKLEQYLEPMKEQFWPTVTEHSMSAWLSTERAVSGKKAFDQFMLTLP